MWSILVAGILVTDPHNTDTCFEEKKHSWLWNEPSNFGPRSGKSKKGSHPQIITITGLTIIYATYDYRFTCTCSVCCKHHHFITKNKLHYHREHFYIDNILRNPSR